VVQKTKVWLEQRAAALTDAGGARYELDRDQEGPAFQREIEDMLLMAQGDRNADKHFWSKYYAQHYIN
jgi:hypothetical protein